MKVLLTSGYPRDELAKHGGDLPSYGFLAKPYAPTALLKALRDLIGRRA